MSGGDLVERTAESQVTPRVIDRELVNRDLERLARTLIPLALRQLDSLRSFRPRLGIGPLKKEVPVGDLMVDRLRDYLPAVISDALAAILVLPDGELRAACAVVAGELGAWCLAGPALTDDQLATGAPALARMLGANEPVRPLDFTGVYEAMANRPGGLFGERNDVSRETETTR